MEISRRNLVWSLISTKFGLLIDFDLLKARTSTNTKPEVVLSDRDRHLEKSIRRHISTVADPEWHDNNGDEVKIKTEKTDGLKARNFSLVVQACSLNAVCYYYVRGWVLAGVEQLYTGNLLTVVLAHYIRTGSQMNLQPCHRNGRQHLPKTIRVK